MQVLIAVSLILFSIITAVYQLYVKEELRLEEREERTISTSFKNEVDRIRNIYRTNYALIHTVNYSRYLNNKTYAIRYINLLFTKNRICAREKISNVVNDYGHDITEVKEGETIDNFYCVTYDTILNSSSNVLKEEEKAVYRMIRPSGDKAILFERTAAIHYKGAVFPQLIFSVLQIKKEAGNKFKILKKVRINSYDIVKEKIKSAEAFLDRLSYFFRVKAEAIKQSSKNPLVSPFTATYIEDDIFLYLNGGSKQAILPVNSYIFLPNSLNYNSSDYLFNHITSCDNRVFKSTLEVESSYTTQDWENRTATEILYKKCRYKTDKIVNIIDSAKTRGRLIQHILPSNSPLYRVNSSDNNPYSYFIKKKGEEYKFFASGNIQQVFTQEDTAIITLTINGNSTLNGMPVVESSIQSIADWLSNQYGVNVSDYINPFTGNNTDLPSIILFDFSSPYLYRNEAEFAIDEHNSSNITVRRVVTDYRFAIAIPYPMDHIDNTNIILPFRNFITGTEQSIDGTREEENAIIPGWFIKIYSIPVVH